MGLFLPYREFKGARKGSRAFGNSLFKQLHPAAQVPRAGLKAEFQSLRTGRFPGRFGGAHRSRNRRSGRPGRGRGTRTPDLRFWRPSLYQLSYTPRDEEHIADSIATAPFRPLRLERVAGIEPAYSAWKAAALPLSYTRGRQRVMLSRYPMQELVRLCLQRHRIASRGRPCPAGAREASGGLVGEVGLEPTKAFASGFTVRPLCHSGHSP